MIRPLLIACLTFTAAAVNTGAAYAAPQEPASTTPATPAATVPAATAVAAPLVGDAGKGKQLTYTCQGCHGVTGYKNAYPNYHVPKIGGQTPQYLVNALSEYRTGKRKHPTMQAQAESFSEQDIADIAAFLSGLK
jgi:cytochrome c553